jgi:hypothetical protein
MNEFWASKIDNACKILSDKRLIKLFTKITDVKMQEIKSLIIERKFQIDLVDLERFRSSIERMGHSCRNHSISHA